MTAYLQRDGPIGTVYECSNNGWTNEELFVVWLRHFQKHVKSTEDNPVLLICDNHQSHISLDTFEFCRENHITLLSIPPHTSHRLQPLDLTFFGPLKGALSREYGLFMVQNAHRRITTADIAGLLNKAYVKVATMEKGVSGFKAAGIFPLNPEKFSAEDFAAAEEFRELIIDADPEPDSVNPAPEATPSTSSVPDSGSGVGLPGDTQHGQLNVTISDVAPIPKFNFQNSNKARANRKEHSQILTSTPMKKGRKINKKQYFEDKKTSKKSKKKPKMRELQESDESNVSNISLTDICDDDELDDVDLTLRDENNEKCIFCYDVGRDNEEWYRCVMCGFWAHAECSGFDSPDNYHCDTCAKKKRRMEKSNLE